MVPTLFLANLLKVDWLLDSTRHIYLLKQLMDHEIDTTYLIHRFHYPVLFIICPRQTANVSLVVSPRSGEDIKTIVGVDQEDPSYF